MTTFLTKKALTFDDVHMVPRKSDIVSRKEIDTSCILKRVNIRLGAPFIASPMSTVSGPKMAIAIQQANAGIAILHRYCSVETQTEWVRAVTSQGYNVGAAVGISGDYLERAQSVISAGAKVICVDVAHGHHVLMERALKELRPLYPDIHIMAGNVATLEGFNDLADWGADSVRLGVGSGSICSTRVKTGHGYPMLQNILDVSVTDRDAQIISDGGIRQYGDIVKAIGAGAHLVMMGSMFAGTEETPGDLIETDRGLVKAYAGMASIEAQTEWRGFHSSNEGVATTVPYKGPVKNILSDMLNGVSSGYSYSGARNAQELRASAIFAEVSHASALEATPHILKN